MTKVGFRVVLPIFQIVLYIALVVLSWNEQMELNRKWAGWIDAPYSHPFAWAGAISLPAVLVAMPINFIVGLALNAHGSADALAIGVSVNGLFIALFWFWLGKKIDYICGFGGGPATQSDRRTCKFIVIGCVAIAAVLALLYCRFARVQYIELKLAMAGWIAVGVWWTRFGGRKTNSNLAGPRQATSE